MAAHRVARRRERACQLLLVFAIDAANQETIDSAGHATVAYRARIRRPQERARARPLRRTTVPRLAPPCLGRTLLLRVHHCGTRAAFSPLGRKVASSRLAVARGLNAISPTASLPHDLRLHASLPGGCRAAPSAAADPRPTGARSIVAATNIQRSSVNRSARVRVPPSVCPRGGTADAAGSNPAVFRDVRVRFSPRARNE